MRKTVLGILSLWLVSSCASVEEVKNVREISKIPVEKKDYFKVGKINPFTPPVLSLKKKKVEVEVVETPLPALMEGVCRQAKVNCDSKSWENIPLPLTLSYKGSLYSFLKLLEERYSLKFSYDGRVLKLYDYDPFEVEKRVNEFYSSLYERELPKITVSFVKTPLEEVLATLTLSSGWTVATDATVDPSKVKKRFTFSGKGVSLKTVLDALAENYGFTYRVEPDEKRITFTSLITKVYRIPVLPKSLSYSYTVSVKSSDGQSNVKKKVSVDEAFWKNLTASIKTCLSPYGKLFVSPETGTVSITDSPVVIKRIDRIMENAVREALSQVSFRVAVYEITFNRGIQTGIDWGAIFKGAKVQFSASGGTGYVLNWSGTGSLFGNPFDYLVKALENYGKVRTLYDNYVKTKSGEQVSIYPTYDYRYVSKITVNYLDNGQISTEPEFDSMTLGMQISLIPKRINSEEVSFDITVANTSLVSEETYTFGGNTFTNPKLVSNNKVSFSSVLKRGQLEVLTGWRGYKIESQNSGVPFISEIPGAGLVAKGKNRKATITEFVVAIYIY